MGKLVDHGSYHPVNLRRQPQDRGSWWRVKLVCPTLAPVNLKARL